MSRPGSAARQILKQRLVRSLRVLALLLTLAGCVACATMAEQGLLPEVQARQAPAVSLGPEFSVQDNMPLGYNAEAKAVVTRDGHGHVFVIDKERAVHHIEIAGTDVLRRETIGVVTGAPSGFSRPDAVEHPPGSLRLVAGDKMFVRSETGVWAEIKGNRCERFVPVGEDLLCTFIAKGEDLGAPTRTDWLVGWFILIPVALPREVQAEKLVIAQDSPDGWTILAVLDPEATLSARSDYVLGADRSGLQFLYRSSGGSSWFLIGGGPYGGGFVGGDSSDQHISYARVDYATLFQRTPDSDAGTKDHPAGWLRVAGSPLPAPPFADRWPAKAFAKEFWRDPLDRRFTVNGALGNIESLFHLTFTIRDGGRTLGVLEQPWVAVRLSGDRWVPGVDIVAADDLPDPGYRWGRDWRALIRSDVHGHNHVLLESSRKGSFDICYFVKGAAGWSAPIVLGGNLPPFALRDLALGDKGNAFAVWKDRNDTVKGRWISPQK